MQRPLHRPGVRAARRAEKKLQGTSARLSLVPAPDDPPSHSVGYQTELREVAAALRAKGLEVSPRVRVHDAVDGGTWYLGEFAIKLAQTGVPAALAAGVEAWLHARYGRKRHAMPCHHNLEEYLTAYLDGAGLRGDPKGPLFCTIGRGTGQLTRSVLPQANAYAMIRRRAAAAGIATKLGNHSFRATGITAYLKNGGTLEKAAAMANHASTRTTQLYDRAPGGAQPR